MCSKHSVLRLAVFGSAVRDDFDPAHSDVDLLVEFDEVGSERYFDNKSALLHELIRTFDRKVDLLTFKSIRNPHLQRSIAATQETLYAT